MTVNVKNNINYTANKKKLLGIDHQWIIETNDAQFCFTAYFFMLLYNQIVDMNQYIYSYITLFTEVDFTLYNRITLSMFLLSATTCCKHVDHHHHHLLLRLQFLVSQASELVTRSDLPMR